MKRFSTNEELGIVNTIYSIFEKNNPEANEDKYYPMIEELVSEMMQNLFSE